MVKFCLRRHLIVCMTFCWFFSPNNICAFFNCWREIKQKQSWMKWRYIEFHDYWFFYFLLISILFGETVYSSPTVHTQSMRVAIVQWSISPTIFAFSFSKNHSPVCNTDEHPLKTTECKQCSITKNRIICSTLNCVLLII